MRARSAVRRRSYSAASNGSQPSAMRVVIVRRARDHVKAGTGAPRNRTDVGLDSAAMTSRTTAGPVAVAQSPGAVLKTLDAAATFDGGFWAQRQRVNREAALPHG